MKPTPSPNSMAGGIVIAVAAMLGAFGGAFFGESSRGLIAGIGVGALIALAIWLLDRRR